MKLQQETACFLIFICLGIIFGIIFDFFRALRKTRKRSDLVVSIQDIIYFLIVGIILSIVLYIYVKDSIRIYLIISIILGIAIYTSIMGNKMVKLFVNILNFNSKTIAFIFVPLDIFRQIFSRQLKKLKKYADNCCKSFLYVIKSKYVKLKLGKSKLVTKEGVVCQELVVEHKSKKRRKS